MKPSLFIALLFIGFVVFGSAFSSCTTDDVEAVKGIDSTLVPMDTNGARGLVINEVLYDPSNTGLEGDANGDGVYNQDQDEFIEIYNNGPTSLNIGGYSIKDSILVGGLATTRFTFPDNTVIPKGKAVLVFGGGTPTGIFGNCQIFLSMDQSGLSMGNSGETINVYNRKGTLIMSFNSDAQSNNPNESYTLNPDITGSFAQHGTAVPGKLFSPGTRINGVPF
jgi:hypothetical protein